VGAIITDISSSSLFFPTPVLAPLYTIYRDRGGILVLPSFFLVVKLHHVDLFFMDLWDVLKLL
jgi:hypothetical protein